MAFERRFNAIRFYSKLNHFVLSPRKKPNHFVLKIRPGGFADYINTELVTKIMNKKIVLATNERGDCFNAKEVYSLLFY